MFPPCPSSKPSASPSSPSWAAKLRSFFTLLGIIVSVGVPGRRGGGHPGHERLREGEPHRRHDRHQRVPGAPHPDRARAAATTRWCGRSPSAADHHAGGRRGGAAARFPTPRRSRCSRAGPPRSATCSYREPDGGRRAGLRRDPALPDRAGLPLRRRRAAGRPGRPRAPAGRGAGLRRGRQAVRRSRRRPSGARSGSAGRELRVKGVIAKKGRVLGQSFDGFVLIPLTHLRERCTAAGRPRRSRSRCATPTRSPARWPAPRRRCGWPTGCGPAEPNDFTVDKADALVAFWNEPHPGAVHRDPRRGRASGSWSAAS